jgi:heme/copper-type cytochrome/quinol oxidase subunit 2
VGIYTVTLHVLDVDGNSADDTVTVTVRDSVHPIAVAGPDIHVSQHAAIILDGTGSSDNIAVVNWSWSFDLDGTPFHLYGPTTTFIFDEAGTFEVTLEVEDAAGNNGTDTMLVLVKDTTPPLAYAGLNVTINQFAELILNGGNSSDNVGVVSWIWNFTYNGAPVRFIGKTQKFIFDKPGIYHITLAVLDAESNSNSTDLKVRVVDTIDPTIDGLGHKTIQKGDKITLDGSIARDNAAIVRWVWTFKDSGKDVVLEGKTASYAFSESGDHKVTLTVYDTDGNTAASTFTVTVRGLSTLMVLAILVIVVVIAAIAFVALKRRGRRAPVSGKPTEKPP